MELIEKLANIQQRLVAPKGQTNKFGGYKYRSCEDILTALKSLLDDCALTITDEIQMIGDRFYVVATATLTNGKDSISVKGYARECESKKGMDDSQLTGSCSSYARKYALNGLFCIDDSKDADTMDNRKPQLPSKLKKLYQQAREHYDAGDLQAVREVLASFEMIEQQRAVMLEFTSNERTAITKYVKENADSRCDVQKADYLTAKEHDQLCKNYGFNG